MGIQRRREAGVTLSNPPLTTVRVTMVSWESESIRRIELRPVGGASLRPFEAGSHLDLYLPNGMIRCYSLVNPQGERHRYVLGVALDRGSRGGSRYIHERLRVGDTLRVGEPRNHFRLNETAPFSLLLGGGIGITPLVSMAARLTELGSEWRLHYAVRSRSEAAFLSDLSIGGERVCLHCDDEAGSVLDLRAAIAGAPAGAHLYCCGPKPMMLAFRGLTDAFEPQRIHVENFAPVEPAALQGGFLVELAKSGRTLVVPKGSSILETLTEAGYDVPSSCRQGVCGTCETRVLAGIPDHRDSILSEAERATNKTMMICCSGCLSEKLVLDI